MVETIKTLEKMDAKIFRVDPEETKAIKNAIKYLKEYQMFKTLYTARLIIDIMPEHKEAFEMAIKALEQESILDKVRAEIKAMSGDIETIADVLAVIDKYKSEVRNKV